MTKFRDGDVVTLEATISGSEFHIDGNDRVSVKFPPYHNILVDPAQLTMKRSHMEPGDQIRTNRRISPFHSRVGKVIAAHGDALWVEYPGEGLSTVNLSEAERCDHQEAEPAAEPVNLPAADIVDPGEDRSGEAA